MPVHVRGHGGLRRVARHGVLHHVHVAPLELFAVLAGFVRERLPAPFLPHHDPRPIGARQPWQLLQDDIPNRVERQRPAQRLAEGHQAFEFGRAGLGLLRICLGGPRQRLLLLAFALLVEDEHPRQDDERGEQRQAQPGLDLARQVQQVLDGFGKDDDEGHGQAPEQQAVVVTDVLHGVCLPGAGGYHGRQTR